MKWMIASDIHGSAKYCRAMLARFDEEGAERLAREHVHKLLQWVRRTQQPSLSQAASPLRPLSRE